MELNFRTLVIFLLMAALALLPPVAMWVDEPFYIDLFSRVLIHAIAAVSLNLLLGYGGMVSFGHAAYLGIGGYVVGISTFHVFEDGVDWLASGWFQFPVAAVVAGLVSLVVGAICLRTKGVYFIMITLAFGQMLFFTAVGLDVYGGDDGLTLYATTDVGRLVDLGDEATLYYVSFGLLLLMLYVMHRLVNARFGRVILGARSNERRMAAIGFAAYPYKLTAFVLAGAACGLAGALMANHDEFVSPSMMHWVKSGDLIIMVVLGGMGTLFGPVLGAVAFLFLEEFLSGVTEHWQIIFGPLLILVVLFARGGIDSLLLAVGGPSLSLDGWLRRRRHDDGHGGAGPGPAGEDGAGRSDAGRNDAGKDGAP
jgi:branched-chain amino acid transport system permease protein